jgi:Fe-S-cluster formation regulator IscX/YfhJ
MGRLKTRINKVQIHAWVNHVIDERLDSYSKDFKMSKNQIIEDAIFSWLNERDSERK